MSKLSLAAAIKNLVFPGSAIIAGKSPDGTCAVTAFLITGLNASGRDCVLTEDDTGLNVSPFTGAATFQNNWPAVLTSGNMMFIGNGGHTAALAEAFMAGKSVRDIISTLPCLEDGKPRISAAACFEPDNSYVNMSIIKQGSGALMRHSFEYSNLKDGTGYMLTALSGSEFPFEPFSGDPVAVEISGSIFDVVADIWENLRPETRVSLWVKSTDLSTGKSMSRIINRNR